MVVFLVAHGFVLCVTALVRGPCCAAQCARVAVPNKLYQVASVWMNSDNREGCAHALAITTEHTHIANDISWDTRAHIT